MRGREDETNQGQANSLRNVNIELGHILGYKALHETLLRDIETGIVDGLFFFSYEINKCECPHKIFTHISMFTKPLHTFYLYSCPA